MTSPHALFRPPAEAYSLIIRLIDGCPWNRCTFCGMYKDVKARVYTMEEMRQAVREARREYPHARRIFLADGDVMVLPPATLREVLILLNKEFPRLARVNIYANGHSILRYTPEELEELRMLKLNTLYMGLESGHENTLKKVKKREAANDMIKAGQRAQETGLKMSVMILTGLGGKTDRHLHTLETAKALNRMQPRLLSALRVIPIPGTELHRQEQQGLFKQLTEYEATEELRDMIQLLDLKSTVFRANHSSNLLPLEGRFPKDKARLLAELTALLESDALDTHSPGPPPISL